MSTLSAKFAKLKAPAAGNSGGNRPRVQQSVANQQNKRAAQNQARRTGTAPQPVKNSNGAGKRVPRGKPILNGVKKNLRKNGEDPVLASFIRPIISITSQRSAILGKGAKSGKGKKAGAEKKTKSTPVDLDADMDRCTNLTFSLFGVSPLMFDRCSF
jgi:hypothetical protein